jgi:DNA polymerase III epsilon subunit-like protein
MTLLRTPVVVLDTETTGIYNKHSYARIWDLAAVLLDVNGVVVDSFEQVILPKVLDDRAEEALKIGGVTQDWIRENGIPEDEAALLWFKWLDRYPEAKCTAFNIQFDRPMLNRCGFDSGIRWGPCLMRLAQAEMGEAGALPQWENGEYKFPKLSEAATYYAVEQAEPAHRALADAKTAAAILLKIQARRMDPTK